MSNETKRYLIPAEGPEVLPIQIGYSLLQKICEELETPKDAILLVPAIGNIQGTTIETALGTRIINTLLKDRRINLPNGGELRLESEQTFRGSRGAKIIMGVHVTKKMLDQIDDERDFETIIIVPWIMEEVKEWIITWNPEILGETPDFSDITIDPVIEEALKSLTAVVNLSSGLVHPSDKGKAVELFRQLYENNYVFDPNSIRIWALRNRWTPEGADQLKDVAQGILNGKRYRTGGGYWKSNIIDILREDAEKNQ